MKIILTKTQLEKIYFVVSSEEESSENINFYHFICFLAVTILVC